MILGYFRLVLMLLQLFASTKVLLLQHRKTKKWVRQLNWISVLDSVTQFEKEQNISFHNHLEMTVRVKNYSEPSESVEYCRGRNRFDKNLAF